MTSGVFRAGVPKASTFGGFEFRYIPGSVVILYGSGEHYTWRVVPMDGRPHLTQKARRGMGDSVGHWEGNTLVVETTNNREGTWFDKHGTFHSEDMRVVERWTMVDENKMVLRSQSRGSHRVHAAVDDGFYVRSRPAREQRHTGGYLP